MATAISYSDNIYAVKTNLFLGSDKFINTMHKCGINEPFQDVASLPLGTSELNILDYANGYLTLASGGYQKKMHIINKITDKEGNILYEYQDVNNLVLNPNYVYILNELLTATYNKAFLDYNTPTAMIINSKASQKYAYKSGTTNTDYWSIGYNNDKLMLLWMGYDDNKLIGTSQGIKSKNIWIDTMEAIKTSNQNNWYNKPDNVIGVLLNAIDGNNPTDINKSFLYYFLKGTEP
jgi:membrane peptidoglycan carboxypeptidase